MASQRVLVLAIGGLLAESIWRKLQHWGSLRTVTTANEWSEDDWPADVRVEIDAFVACIASAAMTPPILYRSEHVDLWSLGDVFHSALARLQANPCQSLYTAQHEVFSTWALCTDQIVLDRNAVPETIRLHSRINEAIASWGALAERRLIVVIRTVLGGLWTDEEVTGSLKSIPAWWTVTGQTQQPETTAESVFDDGSISPVR